MKLYAMPLACSLASHIMLREAGGPFTIEWVDPSGPTYRLINQKAKVPALETAEGLLTRSSVQQAVAQERAYFSSTRTGRTKSLWART